jgi:hypothetical protein
MAAKAALDHHIGRPVVAVARRLSAIMQLLQLRPLARAVLEHHRLSLV